MHQRRKKWRINADPQEIADRTEAEQDAPNPADSARKETAERTGRPARRRAVRIRDGDRARISKHLPTEPRDAAPLRLQGNPSSRHRVRVLVSRDLPAVPQADAPARAVAGRSINPPRADRSLMPLVKSFRRREMPMWRMPLPMIVWRAEIRFWKHSAPDGHSIRFG